MPCIVMSTILTVVTSVRSLPILAAGGEQRFRPLHGARALRGDFEGRREYSLNSENISNSTWELGPLCTYTLQLDNLEVLGWVGPHL